MNRKNIIFLIIIIGLQISFNKQSLASFSFEDLTENFTEDSLNPLKQYPELKNREVKLYKGKSSLDPESNSTISSYLNKLKNNDNSLFNAAQELLADGLLNKFSVGNGIVDVTYQVKKGVKLAIKDSFQGFAEFQRRKITEEMVNANLSAHHKANEFFLSSHNSQNLSSSNFNHNFFNEIIDFSFDLFYNNEIKQKSIFLVIKKIFNSSSINKIFQLFQAIAIYALIFMTTIIIFKRVFIHSLEFEYAIWQPLSSSILVILLIKSINFIFNQIINFAIIVQASINLILESNIQLESHRSLAESWQLLANKVGYLPVQILSCLDILAQFFAYFFITGIILLVILGKILSPIWSLSIMSNSFKTNAYNSFLNWLKAIIVIIVIPLMYKILAYIASDFNSEKLYLLEISISIASFLYLPALANIILARGTGLIEPAFNGYHIVVDTLNQGFQELKSSIKESSWHDNI